MCHCHGTIYDHKSRMCKWIYYLHAHEEIGRLPPLEAVLSELPAHLLHLGMLVQRAKVWVEFPHGSPKEAVGRP